MKPNLENLQSLQLQEAQLCERSRELLARVPELADHLSIIQAAMDLMHAIGALLPAKDDDARAIQRLALRAFNNMGAIWRLLSAGYFQPAVMHIRDMVEVGQLVELFAESPDRIALFRTLDRKGRRKAFAPSKVREELDALKLKKASNRAEIYGRLSRLAGHPDIEGFTMQQPVGELDAAWGPFMQLEMLRATLEETAKWAAFAGCSFQQLLDPSTSAGRVVACHWGVALIDWSSEHMGMSYPAEQRADCIDVIARGGRD